MKRFAIQFLLLPLHCMGPSSNHHGNSSVEATLAYHTSSIEGTSHKGETALSKEMQAPAMTNQSDLVQSFLGYLKAEDSLSLYNWIQPELRAEISTTGLGRYISTLKKHYGQIQSANFKGSKTITENGINYSIEINNCFSEVEGVFYLKLRSSSNDSTSVLSNFYFIPRKNINYPFVEKISESTLREIRIERYDSLYSSSSSAFKEAVSAQEFESIKKLLKQVKLAKDPSQYYHYFTPSGDGIALQTYFYVADRKNTPLLLKLRFKRETDWYELENIGLKTNL